MCHYEITIHYDSYLLLKFKKKSYLMKIFHLEVVLLVLTPN